MFFTSNDIFKFTKCSPQICCYLLRSISNRV